MNNILLVNASNKLKVFKGKLDSEDSQKINSIKDKYKKNKETAIIHCKNFIKYDNYYYDFFLKHKKKDDLADSYLMCKYFIG